MTYNVFGGKLSLTQSINQPDVSYSNLFVTLRFVPIATFLRWLGLGTSG